MKPTKTVTKMPHKPFRKSSLESIDNLYHVALHLNFSQPLTALQQLFHGLGGISGYLTSKGLVMQKYLILAELKDKLTKYTPPLQLLENTYPDKDQYARLLWQQFPPMSCHPPCMRADLPGQQMESLTGADSQNHALGHDLHLS